MALTQWSPFGNDDEEMPARRRDSRDSLRELHREMNRLFENFFGGTSMMRRREPGSTPAPRSPNRFNPRIEVSEDSESLSITAELPGMTKDDIELYCDDESVTLQGEKSHEESREDEGFHRTERSYGYFKRRIPFPTGVDSEQAEAHFEDGLLEVRFPKTGESQGKQLEIE